MEQHPAWVRPWTPDDMGVVERIAGRAPELWDQLPPRDRMPDLFYGRRNGTDGRWKLAVCDPTGPVGNVALRLLGSGNAACSYWLAPEARGRGLATRATAFACALAFEELDVHRIELSHRVDNLASAAVAERCGFTLEGTRRDELLLHGRRYDTRLWSLLRTDPRPQVEPLTLDPA